MPIPSEASQAASRAEYLGRIHRVTDYVETHLDQPMSLEELAHVACFSPFHFHRIFSAIAGESLYQFILRLRLERAAQQLCNNPGKSVTAIALDCGFGSSATFARAFRASFGTSATAWRCEQSKICKMDRKVCKEPGGPQVYVSPVGTDRTDATGSTEGRPTMTRNPATRGPSQKEALSSRIETMAPLTVAYLRHVGPYAGDSTLFKDLYGRVMQWAGARGLLGKDTKALTIYHDNPEITDEQKLRISVCVSVPPGTRPEGEIGVMEIPAGKYAVARFELAVDEFDAAWNWMMGSFIPSSGFQPDDRPCFELELNDPKDHPEHKFLIEIWEPVRPL
jgi:AraC family transcriptional regulator